MDSTLDPLLANIFMSSLEEEVLPTLGSCLCNWKGCVGDTHAYIITEKVQFILKKLKIFKYSKFKY